jgi:fructose-specific phosphotransferase system component IIB
MQQPDAIIADLTRLYDEAVATLREVAERVEVNLKVSKKGDASLYARLTTDDLEDAADAIETP